MCVFQKNSMLKSVQLKSDVSLLRSQTEQGTAESQDWLLGPERVLRHLQPIWPMRRQLAEVGPGSLSLFQQLSEGVLQLTEHVESKHT